jgi:hypothetical protein
MSVGAAAPNAQLCANRLVGGDLPPGNHALGKSTPLDGGARWGEAVLPKTKIIAVLRENGTRVKIAELCRKYGISDATFYNWKATCGGMEVFKARGCVLTDHGFSECGWRAANLSRTLGRTSRAA